MPTEESKSGLHVYQAILAVMAELATEGVAKSRKNEAQRYNFRGVDDIVNALAPLLPKHKLCVLPRMIARTCTERQAGSGKTMLSVAVEAEYDIVSVIDGSKHTVKTFGEGMDFGDKATNKAMSAAYKYGMVQTFCIPTEGVMEDPDNHNPPPSGSGKKEQAQNQQNPLKITRQQWDEIKAAVEKHGAKLALLLAYYEVQKGSELSAALFKDCLTKIESKFKPFYLQAPRPPAQNGNPAGDLAAQIWGVITSKDLGGNEVENAMRRVGIKANPKRYEDLSEADAKALLAELKKIPEPARK